MGVMLYHLKKEWLYQEYVIERKSTLQIAKEIGCCGNTVYLWLKRFNIPTRSIGEANLGRCHSLKTRQKISKTRLRKTGGKIIRDGYTSIYKPEIKEYVFEHRLIMEKRLGRPLKPSEKVHHIDGNKQNNDPKNLFLTTAGDHKSGYLAGYKQGFVCGSLISMLLIANRGGR